MISPFSSAERRADAFPLPDLTSTVTGFVAGNWVALDESTGTGMMLFDCERERLRRFSRLRLSSGVDPGLMRVTRLRTF
jgi:hypothetical protein